MGITKQEHDDVKFALVSATQVLLRARRTDPRDNKPGLGEIARTVSDMADLFNRDRYVADTMMQNAAILELAWRYEIVPQQLKP